MESPVVPSIANLYMEEYECKLIFNENSPFKKNIKLWLRYVDVFFWLFMEQEDLVKFKKLIDQLHTTIRYEFTTDHQSVLFLGMVVFKETLG